MAGAPSGPFDPEGLSTVHELPYHKTSHDAEPSVEHRSIILARHSGSRDPSINSSFARSYNESLAAEPPPGPYTTAPRKTQHAPRLSDGKLKKADRRNTVGTELSGPNLAQRPRRGGLRNTIRRMFGRRSTRNRASMPTGTNLSHNDPEEFITSATSIRGNDRKVERSASLPTNAFIRSSGLSSHPPSQPPALPLQSETPSQVHIERENREPPTRPSRPSVPSSSFTREDLQAVTDAMSGIGILTNNESNVDARNIGFAVTNGSNPRRRSRSVGAFRASDHRMSPIQWRHLRTKSDDFTYCRGSKEIIEKPEARPEEAQEEAPEHNTLNSQEVDFNFGLQDDSFQANERIGLEERLMTLEIKLMDFEYTLSKIQAGSLNMSSRTSKRAHNRQDSVETGQSSGAPSASVEVSSAGASPMTQEFSNNRPTSVATTLKAGQNPQSNSFWRSSVQTEKRLSLSALTIEHYTTLVTLIRREQSARMRLEEQVQQLQNKLEKSPDSNGIIRNHPDSRSNHHRDVSSSSHLSRRFGTLNDDGRRRAKYYLDGRHRSSSYSTNDTDTEDDYHDAYVTPNVTPVERGEYERGAFNRIPGVEEGEAF